MKRTGASFVFTALLGVYVLICVIEAQTFPDSLQILTGIAGYGTLFLIVLLLLGHFFPGLLSWTETALQDVWGGKGTDAKSVGRDEGGEEAEPVPPAAIARSMGYAIGFLILVFLFGFYAVPPLFLATYLILDARVPARWAILSGIVATAMLVGGMRAVNVDVWLGAIPEVIPNYLGGSIVPPL